MSKTHSLFLVVLAAAVAPVRAGGSITQLTPALHLRGGGLFGKSTSTFDPTFAQAKVKRMWNLHATFGHEEKPRIVYLEEIVSDRFALISGAQVIRDELMLAFNKPKHKLKGAAMEDSDVSACAADLSLPSVLSTCGLTNCGDRICQTHAHKTYMSTVPNAACALPNDAMLSFSA
eukprot:538170-Rhodomonas_salina.3